MPCHGASTVPADPCTVLRAWRYRAWPDPPYPSIQPHRFSSYLQALKVRLHHQPDRLHASFPSFLLTNPYRSIPWQSLSRICEVHTLPPIRRKRIRGTGYWSPKQPTWYTVPFCEPEMQQLHHHPGLPGLFLSCTFHCVFLRKYRLILPFSAPPSAWASGRSHPFPVHGPFSIWSQLR